MLLEEKLDYVKAKNVRLTNGYSIDEVFKETSIPRLTIVRYEEGEINPLEDTSENSAKYLSWIRKKGYSGSDEIVSEDEWTYVLPPYREIPEEEPIMDRFNQDKARATRIKLNLSSLKVSELMGVNYNCVNQYENGQLNPLTSKSINVKKYLCWLKDNGYDNLSDDELNKLSKISLLGSEGKWKTIHPTTGVEIGTFLFHEPMEKVTEAIQKIFPKPLESAQEEVIVIPRGRLQMPSVEENELMTFEDLNGLDCNNLFHGFVPIKTDYHKLRLPRIKIIHRKLKERRNRYTKICPLPKEFHGEEHLRIVVENTDRLHPELESILSNY